MSYYQEFLTEVDRGQQGESVFIPLRGEKLGSRISVAKSMYFLFGGMPGSGKTAIVDSIFVLDIYDWWQKNKDKVKVRPHWIYRSMERARYLKVAKWTCYKLYQDHGLLIDVPTLLNWPNKLFDLSAEQLVLIRSYDSYFAELFQHVEIIDGAMNPTGIWKYAYEYALKNGELVLDPNGHTKTYVPNDPNLITFHITDHVGKIQTETPHGGSGVLNDKQILDKHSEYMGILRDKFFMVPVDICQLNREIEDTMRGLKTELDVQPKDFKGSGDMYENADVVIGLLNPYKLKVMYHMEYDIKRFVDKKGYNRFRSLKCLKNSWGIDDFAIGYRFLGENGGMEELPKASLIDGMITKYEDFL